jgi:hypothetical protein
MTDHPIAPSLELVQQWTDEIYGGPGVVAASDDICLAKLAAQWGADEELEACCEWLESEPDPGHVDLLRSCATALRAARRPKPPSLKEQALMALEDGDTGPGASLTLTEVSIIRRALEALPDD